jgi:hypothetical protein
MLRLYTTNNHSIMKNSRFLLLTFLIVTSHQLIKAQNPSTGLNFDIPSYRGTPYKAKLTVSSYAAMPAAASVEQYAPTPGEQVPTTYAPS